jgi:hypothetical protein
MIAGTGLAAMFLVLQGDKTWRNAGSNAAEFVLGTLEIEPEEARGIANLQLPPLPK